MPTPAAEPMPGPVFVITDTLYRLAGAVLAASTLALLVALVTGILAEEGLSVTEMRLPYQLTWDLIGVMIIGVVAGAAVIGPARTARQLALGALLIKASQEPSARPVRPDPRGPIGRPFLPATLTVIGVIDGAIPTLIALSDEPDTAIMRWALAGVLVAAVIAVPLLVLAPRRWRSRTAPLLRGQMTAPVKPLPVGPSAARSSARRRSIHWLPWLYAAGLVIFFGVLVLSRFDRESEGLSYGEPIASVVEIALLSGGGLIATAVLLTVITRLVRPIREAIRLRRLINAPPGRTDPEPDLSGVAPAARASGLAIGAAVWLGEWLLGLGRLGPTADPVLGTWQARLPDLLTGWGLISVLIIAASAGACVLDSRWRNQARSTDDRSCR